MRAGDDRQVADATFSRDLANLAFASRTNEASTFELAVAGAECGDGFDSHARETHEDE